MLATASTAKGKLTADASVILQLLDRLEAAEKDAKRYCAVLSMSSNQMLRLYNMRFDLREQLIDAVMEAAETDKAMEAK